MKIQQRRAVPVHRKFHFRHIRHSEEFLADRLGIALEFSIGKPVTGQRKDIAEGIAKLVIEIRAVDTTGKCLADITDLLADLVPDLLQIP